MRAVYEMQGKLAVFVGPNTLLREVTFFLEEGNQVTLETTNERLKEVFKTILMFLDREGDSDKIFVPRPRKKKKGRI